MQIVSIIMACFGVLGAIDYLIGNKFGIGKEFDRAFKLLGTMALTMVGMIVLAPTIGHYLSPAFDAISNVIPIDPSVIAGSFLANDMGGWPLAKELATTQGGAILNGLVISSMLGATISFTLPFVLTTVKKERHPLVVLGLLCGICVIPVGVLVSALILGLSMSEILMSVLPLLIICIVLALLLWFFPKFCLKAFTIFGHVMRVIIIFGLVVGIFEAMTGWDIIPHNDPVMDGVSVIFNATCFMTGAFTLINILSRLLKRPLELLGGKIGINATSAMGFIGSLATNVTTFANADKMDDKGLVLNSAFAVSASWALCGHLAYTMSTIPDALPAVIVGKLLSGIAALVVALLLYKPLSKKINNKTLSKQMINDGSCK